MRAAAVIGAAFGDEGKGAVVDYLSGPDTTVVRYCGGAQAGHTVVTPQARRHVFHHFGSGTFRGASTYLGKHFIANPILWAKEAEELDISEARAQCHPEALLTTPYDMLINQEVERWRGAGRHGSCGAGINETWERCQTPYRTTVSDTLLAWGDFVENLDHIRKDWAFERWHTLTGTAIPPQLWKRLRDDNLLAHYLTDCREFRRRVLERTEPVREKLVFEGSQGLLLDEDHSFGPDFVTRGKVGLPNILSGWDVSLDVYYVVRAYMTRHGPGPFPTEIPPHLDHVEDATNKENEWQGPLRYGAIDPGLIADAIRDDLDEAGGRDVSAGLVVTHLDQVVDPRGVMNQLTKVTGLPVWLEGWGPTREHYRRT